MFDPTHQKILSLLRENSRASWAEIGQHVHLSGQAVALRVRALEECGAISGYTIREDSAVRHFVTVFMSSTDFAGFESRLAAWEWVESAYKIAGEGCYELVVRCDLSDLEAHLGEVLVFGRYRVSHALRRIK